MTIIKFPKRFKKKDLILHVKVKCEKCKAKFLIDDIEDFYDTGLRFDDFDVCVFATRCPVCERSQSLEYHQCVKIQRHLEVLDIINKDE